MLLEMTIERSQTAAILKATIRFVVAWRVFRGFLMPRYRPRLMNVMCMILAEQARTSHVTYTLHQATPNGQYPARKRRFRQRRKEESLRYVPGPEGISTGRDRRCARRAIIVGRTSEREITFSDEAAEARATARKFIGCYPGRTGLGPFRARTIPPERFSNIFGRRPFSRTRLPTFQHFMRFIFRRESVAWRGDVCRKQFSPLSVRLPDAGVGPRILGSVSGGKIVALPLPNSIRAVRNGSHRIGLR